jgi:hypothetical protein
MSWNWIDYDNTYSLTNCIASSYRFTNTNSDCNINPASNNFAYANGNRDFFATPINLRINDPNGDCNPNSITIIFTLTDNKHISNPVAITKSNNYFFTDTNTCINSDTNIGSTPICACFSYSDSANTATKCITNPYSNTTSDRIFTDAISIANSI